MVGKYKFFIITGIAVLLVSCLLDRQLVPFKENELYGLKTEHNKVKVYPIYDRIIDIENSDYFIAKKGRKWGLVDKKGTLLTEISYSNISQNYDLDKKKEVFRVGLAGKYGLIDGLGNEILPMEYQSIRFSGNGKIAVVLNRKYGVLNTNGEEIIPLTYDYLEVPKGEDELIVASIDGKYGYINFDNDTVIPFEYSGAKYFSEGLAMVSVALHSWGYINLKNELVVPFDYEYPYFNNIGSCYFKNGLAQVKKDKKCGYINAQGDTVIPFRYSTLGYFYNGFASVERDSLYGYVDTLGQEYLIKEFDNEKPEWGEISKAPMEIPDYSDKLYVYQKTKSTSNAIIGEVVFYVADSNGNQVIDTSYYEYKYPPDEPEVEVEPSKWTLETVLNEALIALRQEPKTYSNRLSTKSVCISYGLLIGGGNYSNFTSNQNGEWTYFKKNTIYEIIGNENLRQITWNWVSPYYKTSFLSMHSFHRAYYIEIIEGLRSYINSYDRKKVERHLRRNEKKFAHYNLDNKRDPNRKIFAFVDRLIILHKLITVEDAKKWINKVADEIATWK